MGRELRFNSSKALYLGIIAIFTFYVLIVGNTLSYGDSVVLYSGAIGVFIILTILRFGLITIPTVSTLFLLFVPMVPFFAKTLAGTIYYSGVDVTTQENLRLVSKTVYLCFVAAALYTAGMIANGNPYKRRKPIDPTSFRVPIFLMGCLFLLTCYLTETGPTLLTGSYGDTLQGRMDNGATLAGVLMTIFWSGFYICYSKYKHLPNRQMQRNIFWFFTILGFIWLFLHSRRTELVGILTVLLIDAATGKGLKDQLRVAVIGIMITIPIFLIGRLRNSALTEARFDQVERAFEAGRKGYSVDVMANAPAGSGNIFLGMLITVKIVEWPEFGLQKGKTYVDYLESLIPTDIRKLLGLGAIKLYTWEMKKRSTGFHGGCYWFAPVYANFGAIGLFIFAWFFGRAIGWVQNCFYRESGIKLYISVIMTVYFIKAYWYEPLFLSKAFYFTFLMYIFMSAIFKKKNNRVLHPSIS